MSDDAWYCMTEGHTDGPVGWGQLKTWAINGSLIPSDLIWTDGWPEWVPAGKVDGLLPDVMNPGHDGIIRGFSDRPGLMTLSRTQLRRFERTTEKPIAFFNRMLMLGDVAPACVISLDPLIVSVYTEEFDTTLLLRFDPASVADVMLEVGSRLLASLFYSQDLIQFDLSRGPAAFGRWNGVDLLIADFLTDDAERLRALKETIPAEQWHRASQQGAQILASPSATVRIGNPYETQKSGEPFRR